MQTYFWESSPRERKGKRPAGAAVATDTAEANAAYDNRTTV